MPKPNYGFAKRQRELEKKRKKEEKALRKDAPPAPALPDAETGVSEAEPSGTSGPDAGEGRSGAT